MYSQLLEDKPASRKRAPSPPRASGNIVVCALAWLFAGMNSQPFEDIPASRKQAKKRQAKKKQATQLQSVAYFEEKLAAAKKLVEDAGANLPSNKASMQAQTAAQTAPSMMITSILQPKIAGLPHITDSFIQDRCLPSRTSVPFRTQRQTPLSAPSSSGTTSGSPSLSAPQCTSSALSPSAQQCPLRLSA
jgi:hypothetical protein